MIALRQTPTLVLYPDCSLTVGLGHITRCIALSHILKKEFGEIYFILKEPENSFFKLVADAGFDSAKINNDEELLCRLTGKEIVVLDGYGFNTEFQVKVKRSGASLVCIDDLHNRHFVADIIINHAPLVSKTVYDVEPYTQLLLGTDYTLIRPTFLAQAKKHRVLPKINSALICFGGSDTRNFTQRVLEEVLKFGNFKRIVVVTGLGYANRDKLKRLLIEFPNRIFHLHGIGELDMVSCVLDVHLAIVPSSGILFEVIACKTPAVSGYYLDNQLDIYKGFKALNCFYDAADFNGYALRSALEEAVNSDADKMMENQGTCIDGMSGERYLEAFKSLAKRFSDNAGEVK